MGDYDEVTFDDLYKLQSNIERELFKFSDILTELSARTHTVKVYDARVVGYPDEAQEKVYGPGSVQIDCPELGIGKATMVFARPRNRASEGAFEYPSIDSWLSVYRDNDGVIYILGYTFPILEKYRSGEEIGYTGATTLPDPFRAGAKMDKVRDNPGKFRLMQSSKGMEFSEDRDTKEVTLRVTDDWKINVVTEVGGTINIGSSEDGQSVDVNVKTGSSGILHIATDGVTIDLEPNKATLTNSDSVITVETATTTVEVGGSSFKIEDAKITMDTTDVDITGDVKITGKLDVTEDISSEAEVTANSKGAMTTLSKHMHATAVPGPASTPTPGT